MKRGTLRNVGLAPPITETAWAAPRCGARSKRTGKPCRAPAMKGKARCYFHGGKSTGPRTEEGKRRQRIAATRHGLYAGPGNPVFGKRAGPLWLGHGAYRKELAKFGFVIKGAPRGRMPKRRDFSGKFKPDNWVPEVKVEI